MWRRRRRRREKTITSYEPPSPLDVARPALAKFLGLGITFSFAAAAHYVSGDSAVVVGAGVVGFVIGTWVYFKVYP